MGNQRIISIDSIQESKKYLDQLDEHSLVLFDVDGVLTVPNEPALHHSNFGKFRHIYKELTASLAFDEKVNLKHFFIGGSSSLIEQEVKLVIESLQNKQIPTYAFTAAFPGRLQDDLEPFHTLRYQILKDLGIDFAINAIANFEFQTCASYKETFPGVHEGIVYAAGRVNGKDEVLRAFLERLTQIEKVLFFEDSSKHLDSVSTLLSEEYPSIELLGFDYRGKQYLPQKRIDEEEFSSFLRSADVS